MELLWIVPFGFCSVGTDLSGTPPQLPSSLFLSQGLSQPLDMRLVSAQSHSTGRDTKSVARKRSRSRASTSESEPLERLYVTLDCLLAILQQIPETKGLPRTRDAETRHARVHTAVSPAAKLRDPNNVDRVLVSAVTAAASAATVLSHRMHPGRDAPRALRACLNILGSAFARVKGAGRAEADLVRQLVAGDGIWPIALKCLDRRTSPLSLSLSASERAVASVRAH